MEKSENIFFVEVRESDEIRRDVLESIKEIVKNLQRFENFKEIRKKKIESINRLEKAISEVSKIIPDLKKSLPGVKIRAVGKRKSRRKKVITKGKKTPEEIAKRKPVTELQKLESDLSEIENKLQGLS
ncbi:MAG: hypothetical protein QGH34_02555 [Candidatus Woesearchaeota archaeon]|jgi:hypothetical protein|nr:hypothetical protein [Candidatus Woesearchaeota archaeon]|tara:strand:- start:18499 stop:18882 length:384 start_codon:yes stop_codon:yes gene_type:complete